MPAAGAGQQRTCTTHKQQIHHDLLLISCIIKLTRSFSRALLYCSLAAMLTRLKTGATLSCALCRQEAAKLKRRKLLEGACCILAGCRCRLEGVLMPANSRSGPGRSCTSCAGTKACTPCKRHWRALRLSAWSRPQPPAGREGCSAQGSSSMLLDMQVASMLCHWCCGPIH